MGKFTLVKRSPAQLGDHKLFKDIIKVLHEVDQYISKSPVASNEQTQAAWEIIQEQGQRAPVISVYQKLFWRVIGTHALPTTLSHLEKLLKPAKENKPGNPAAAQPPETKPELPKDHVISPEVPMPDEGFLTMLQDPKVEPLVIKQVITYLFHELRAKGMLEENQKALLELCFKVVWGRSHQFNKLVSTVGFDGMHSLLLTLVQEGDLEHMKFLLERLRKVLSDNIRLAKEHPVRDVRDYVGLILGAAMYKGDADKVDAILEKQPNVNVRLADGKTPLHLAAMRGHRHIIEKLGHAGADPGLKDDVGKTPPDYFRTADQ